MGLVRMTTAAARARAILLALVLLLQGLVPAAALAHEGERGLAGLQICTGEGLRRISAHHERHGFAGLACEQCVMASFAIVDAAPPPLRLRAEALVFVFLPAAERPSIQPRAPPRPPSQGPPVSV